MVGIGRAPLVAMMLLATPALIGCTRPQATVTGTVTADGRPVTGGTIVLAPLNSRGGTAPGKPGTAEIDPDGSYALTLLPGDTGLAGRFTVRFTPPVLPPMDEARARVTLPPYQGYVPKRTEVDVAAGANVVDIDLEKAAAR